MRHLFACERKSYLTLAATHGPNNNKPDQSQITLPESLNSQSFRLLEFNPNIPTLKIVKLPLVALLSA